MRKLIVFQFLLISFNCKAQFDTLGCVVYGNSLTPAEWVATRLTINDSMMEYDGCGAPFTNPSIHLAVIEPGSCIFWETICSANYGHSLGNMNDCTACRSRAERYFIYRTLDSNSMMALNNTLNDSIPNGHFIILYSFNTTNFSLLNNQYPSLVTTFANLGFTSITQHSDTIPFIYFSQIGNPSAAVELYGLTINDYLELKVPLYNCQLSLLGVNENNETVGDILFPSLLSKTEKLRGNTEEIFIYDLNGKLVLNQKSIEKDFDISTLISGVYIVKGISENKNFVQKISVTE